MVSTPLLPSAMWPRAVITPEELPALVGPAAATTTASAASLPGVLPPTAPLPRGWTPPAAPSPEQAVELALAGASPLRTFAQLAAAHPSATASAVRPRSLVDLPGDVQRAVRDEMRPHAGDPAVLRRYANLVSSDAFLDAPRDAQLAAVRTLSRHTGDPAAYKHLRAMLGADGFAALPAAAQEKALAAAAAPGRSDATRAALHRLVGAEEFAALSPQQQAGWLDALRSTQAGVADRAAARLDRWMDLPAYQARGVGDRAIVLGKLSRAASEPETFDVPPGAYDHLTTKSALAGGKTAPSSAFESGPAAEARTWTVTVGKQSIEVVIPTQPDPAGGRYPDIEQIRASLERMPASSRKELKQIVVEPRAEADTGARARGHGVVSVYPESERRTPEALTSMLVHEAGHELGSRVWGEIGQRGKGWAAWEKAGESDGKWASSYASTSINEDLAETMVLYQHVRGTPAEAEWRARMPARFAILDGIVK